jgi:uncharacterized protein (TIGR02466 family)
MKNRRTNQQQEDSKSTSNIEQLKTESTASMGGGRGCSSVTTLLFFVFCVLLSFGFGYFIGKTGKDSNCSLNKSHLVPNKGWNAFPASHTDQSSQRLDRKKANYFFQKASQFSGEAGEGRQGWLNLLAAYSYNRKDHNIVSNLVNNYLSVGYEELAYSTLLESNFTGKKELQSFLPLETVNAFFKWKEEYFKKINDDSSLQKRQSLDPGEGKTNLFFATAVSKWNLLRFLSRPSFNEEIYNHSVSAYLKLKQQNPKLSSTDLNHEFFRLQMKELDDSSSFWSPLTAIPGFSDLVFLMRMAVFRFLRDFHGFDQQSALSRAVAHPLIVWISVHDEFSTHQPHVTEDALVGGVYYINCPEGSGELELFDPRGKHPIHGLTEVAKEEEEEGREQLDQSLLSVGEPPFHRSHSVVPEEGNLILFPGWLVHSVRNPASTEEEKEEEKETRQGRSKREQQGRSKREQQARINFSGKYRVSMSLNLKGEWIDTSGAAFGNSQ